MADVKAFEKDMARLEEIVKLLEKGEAPLGDSLKLFEEGTALVKKCGAVLDQTERKIRMLSGTEGEPVTEPFEVGAEEFGE